MAQMLTRLSVFVRNCSDENNSTVQNLLERGGSLHSPLLPQPPPLTQKNTYNACQ